MDKNKISIIKIAVTLIVVIAIIFAFMYFADSIGISKSGLEDDIRESKQIKDDWVVTGDVSNTMAAFISYLEDKDDHIYSVYVNRSGLSFGYFFRHGGSLINNEKGVAEYRIDGYNESAFISMNEQEISRLEIDDGNSVKVVEIDKDKPFAIVLPINLGVIKFYDVDNKEIEIYTSLV